MKLFKNSYDHVQTCLRAKHTMLSCRQALVEMESKHNDIASVKTISTFYNQDSSCLFAKIDQQLFRILLIKSDETMKKSVSLKSHCITLMNKIGVCTCLKLDFLFQLNMFGCDEDDANSVHIDEKLCSTIFDYLFSVYKYQNESLFTNESNNSSSDKGQHSSGAQKIGKRRSIFLPSMNEYTNDVQEIAMSQSLFEQVQEKLFGNNKEKLFYYCIKYLIIYIN